jgi:hypothetical protein
MATEDISRAAFDPRKHYAGVRMQQGRVITDDDWNEQECIESEDERRSRVDIIGPAGSPDQGFKIANPAITNSQVGFDIAAGTFYLGGLRLEMDKAQVYRSQSDWLQQPGQPPVPTADRVDLVYLEVFQEPVGAVEDGELFEVALGGPDTSMRVRTMQRVRVLENVSPSCDQAWQKLVGKLPGVVNEDSELVTDARLTVTYKPGGAPEDLCTPAGAGGYLGAENQAIRVQLVTPDSLTWALDNAAPLYRVQLDATRKKVTFLTDPKDQAHWPLAGQIVELLPWSAVLPNNEKVAEIQGYLAVVDGSYNPDTRQLTLTSTVPTAGFDDWQSRPDKADLAAPGVYYYLRLWNRGADRASPPAIPFVVGTPIDLGQTGLQVTINGAFRIPGDYWIIAARPETPNRVVPWQLEQARRPHGVRRYYGPLALITWTFQGGALATVDVHDCRHTFPPLTRLRTCCTLTVGDGQVSFGDYNSLADALSGLPAAGGNICLLAGVHLANAVIEHRTNIRISGCAGRTRVIPWPDDTLPIFQIKDSQGIVLESMDLATLEGTAIVVEGSAPGKVRDIEIGHNRIVAYRNAIQVMQGAGIYIHHNKIRMLDKEGGDVAIFILADDGLIERNDISIVPPGTVPPPPPGGDGNPDPTDPCADLKAMLGDRYYVIAYLDFIWAAGLVQFSPTNPFQTLGGIQVGSGSERIVVLQNRINGGAGNGITLGSDLDPADMPPDEATPEETVAPQIVSPGKVIVGQVAYRGNAVAGTPVVLQGTSGPPLMTVTDSSGRFVINEATPGMTYAVAISDPTHRIARVAIGDYFRVDLARGQPQVDLAHVLAFIYDVWIDENEISNMGLSGIGVPQVQLDRLGNVDELRRLSASNPQWIVLFLLAHYFGVLNGFTVNLTIQGNLLHDCLQNPIEPRLKAAVLARGVGGISLGLCENLRIDENRVENNGSTQSRPACGVFALFVDQLDIGRNQVLGNGPASEELLADLRPGVWGGIFVPLASAFAVTTRLAPTHGAIAKGGHAARIHDNVVSQPVGRGLTLGAFGPVSVLDNRFHTAIAGPGNLDTLVGAVLLLNLGGMQDIVQVLQYRKTIVFTPTADGTGAPAAGGDAVPPQTTGWQAAWGRNFTVAPGLAGLGKGRSRFPGGATLFGNNQTQLGAGQRSTIAQLVATAGDLGFLGNESDMLATNQNAGQVNSLLGGMTLRASNSRFTEVIEDVPKLSLLTLSLLMNNTTHNQGNYCTVAINLLLPAKKISTDNQALLATVDACSQVETALSGPRFLVAALVALARRS